MNARRVFVGVVFNYLGVVATALSGFIATPIILHHIGRAVFGEWALIGALLGYASLLDFGIGLTVMRMVAERAHKPERSELNRLTSSALVVYTLLGLAVTIAGLIAAQLAGTLFHIGGVHAHAFKTALMVMSLIMGITFPAALYTGINQGFGAYRQQNTIVIAQTVGGTVGGIAAVLDGAGLLGLTVVWAAATLAAFAAKAIYARRAYGVTPSLRRFDRGDARELVGTSVWMFIINIAGKVIWDSDTIVVGAILGPVSVAHYSVALGPATAVRRITDQFSSVSLTAASGLKARSELEGLQRLLLEATRMVTVVIAPFLVLFALWGGQFLAIWVGPAFRSSASTLTVLLAGMLATAIQSAAGQVLVALGRQRRIALIAVGEAVANLGLSILLAHEIGIEGVAIGTAIPTTITALFIYVPYAAHLVGVPLLRVAQRLLLPAVVCAGTFASCKLAELNPGFTSLPVFVVFAVGFVAVLGALAVILDGEERQTYLSLIAFWRAGARPST